MLSHQPSPAQLPKMCKPLSDHTRQHQDICRHLQTFILNHLLGMQWFIMVLCFKWMETVLAPVQVNIAARDILVTSLPLCSTCI